MKKQQSSMAIMQQMCNTFGAKFKIVSENSFRSIIVSKANTDEMKEKNTLYLLCLIMKRIWLATQIKSSLSHRLNNAVANQDQR